MTVMTQEMILAIGQPAAARTWLAVEIRWPKEGPPNAWTIAMAMNALRRRNRVFPMSLQRLPGPGRCQPSNPQHSSRISPVVGSWPRCGHDNRRRHLLLVEYSLSLVYQYPLRMPPAYVRKAMIRDLTENCNSLDVAVRKST